MLGLHAGGWGGGGGRGGVRAKGGAWPSWCEVWRRHAARCASSCHPPPPLPPRPLSRHPAAVPPAVPSPTSAESTTTL